MTEIVQIYGLACNNQQSLCSVNVYSFIHSQGPKVNDDKLREMCSAVVEGAVCTLYVDLITSISSLIFNP